MNTLKENFTFTKLIMAAPFVYTLLIATMPSNAEAGVCGRLGAKANCVDSKDVKNNSLSGIDILDNSLSSVDILDNNLTTSDILDNSLAGVDVQDDSLNAADLKDEAGADFVESGSNQINFTAAAQIISSVQVTAPQAGVIIVNASGWFDFGTTANFVDCSLSLNGAVDFTTVLTEDHAADPGSADDDEAFALTRGFPVNAGTTTVNLVCDSSSATGGVENVSMTAMYFPTRY